MRMPASLDLSSATPHHPQHVSGGKRKQRQLTLLQQLSRTASGSKGEQPPALPAMRELTNETEVRVLVRVVSGNRCVACVKSVQMLAMYGVLVHPHSNSRLITGGIETPGSDRAHQDKPGLLASQSPHAPQHASTARSAWSQQER